MRTWNPMRLNKLKCNETIAVDMELRASIQHIYLFARLFFSFTLIFQSVDIAHFIDRLFFRRTSKRKWNILLNATNRQRNIKKENKKYPAKDVLEFHNQFKINLT